VDPVIRIPALQGIQLRFIQTFKAISESTVELCPGARLLAIDSKMQRFKLIQLKIFVFRSRWHRTVRTQLIKP
jgi:hypothetical protein